VVWNINVLKNEEEHRGRHLRRECMCEVRFEGEDGEKVMREGHTNARVEGTSQAQNSVQHTVQENSAAHVQIIGDASQVPVLQQWQNYGPVPNSIYLGFQPPQEDIQTTDPNQSYAIAVGANNPQSQLMMGEFGSGMKWYPNLLTEVPQDSRPCYKSFRGYKSVVTGAARDSKLALNLARLELGSSTQDAGASESRPAGGDTDPQQPMVVSSNNAGLDSA
jgi:hypothetical protein